jgi:hypothetical protein
MRLPDKSSGSLSPRFSRQRRIKAASSGPIMIRASDPPMNWRRSGFVARRILTSSNANFIGSSSPIVHCVVKTYKGVDHTDIGNIIPNFCQAALW